MYTVYSTDIYNAILIMFIMGCYAVIYQIYFTTTTATANQNLKYIDRKLSTLNKKCSRNNQQLNAVVLQIKSLSDNMYELKGMYSDNMDLIHECFAENLDDIDQTVDSESLSKSENSVKDKKRCTSKSSSDHIQIQPYAQTTDTEKTPSKTSQEEIVHEDDRKSDDSTGRNSGQ